MRIGQYIVEPSRLDKIMFPQAELAKADLIDYYRRIAPTMLPHLRGRPISMERYPDGVGGERFYQKGIPRHFPEWVDRETVPMKKGGEKTQVVCNKAATLVLLADQGCITPHVWLSRTDHLEQPDRLIVDVDPPGEEFQPVRQAAFLLRDQLEELGLVPFVMTTGSRGVHVTVPITPGPRFDETRAFVRDLCRLLVERRPDQLTMEPSKVKRGDRTYLDTARNGYAQTAVPPYALRARPDAPVATPVDWRELSNRSLHAASYGARNIFRRLSQKEDPWRDIQDHARALAEPRRRLDRLASGSRS